MCFTPQCPRMGCWEMEGYFSQPFLKRQSHQYVQFFFISRESVHCPGTVFHQLFKTLHGYLLLLYYLVLSTLASLVQSILLLVDCEINLSIKLLHNIVTTIACILLGNPFKRYLLMLHSPQALSRLFLVIFYFLLLHY